jgi:phage tail-like protein
MSKPPAAPDLYEALLPVAFQFSVTFTGSPHIAEAAFREVSGIGAELELETVVEGGENRFVHQLPKGVRHTRLVLKRGIAPRRSTLVGWCRDTLEAGLAVRLVPRHVRVSLIDKDGNPLRAWKFEHAYPAKWSVDGFDSTKNQVALEIIELAYARSTREL